MVLIKILYLFFYTCYILVSEKSTIKESESSLMNDKVKPALNLTHNWEIQNVFESLNTDFMKPVTDIVERLLNETDIKVAVYNGQLDLIVDTPGKLIK